MELKSRIIIMERVLFVIALPMCLARHHYTGSAHYKTVDNGSTSAILNRISEITAENCEGGANNAIDLVPDYSLWEESTLIARLTSNLMTSIILRNHGSVDSLNDTFYYDVIKNNVAGQSKIFASSITLIPGFHPEFELFAPYAFIRDGNIHASDLSEAYDYTGPGIEWWEVPSNKHYYSVAEVTTMTKMQGDNENVIETLLVALRKDGHWTKPYFDCGGGDIWLTTHTSPIFGRNDKTGKPEFKGVAYIDIDLSSLDINQCDTKEPSDAFFNVFRGTHKCPENSECQFKPGTGLKRGGYQCVCKTKGHRYYKRKLIEGAELEKESTSRYYRTKVTC